MLFKLRMVTFVFYSIWHVSNIQRNWPLSWRTLLLASVTADLLLSLPLLWPPSWFPFSSLYITVSRPVRPVLYLDKQGYESISSNPSDLNIVHADNPQIFKTKEAKVLTRTWDYTTDSLELFFFLLVLCHIT